MKLKLFAAALVASAASAIIPAHADTKDYIRICGNPRLSVADRLACTSEMRAATTDFGRTEVFRIYDYKTVGFAIDGTRIRTTSIQAADAEAK